MVGQCVCVCAALENSRVPPGRPRNLCKPARAPHPLPPPWACRAGRGVSVYIHAASVRDHSRTMPPQILRAEAEFGQTQAGINRRRPQNGPLCAKLRYCGATLVELAPKLADSARDLLGSGKIWQGAGQVRARPRLVRIWPGSIRIRTGSGQVASSPIRARFGSMPIQAGEVSDTWLQDASSSMRSAPQKVECVALSARWPPCVVASFRRETAVKRACVCRPFLATGPSRCLPSVAKCAGLHFYRFDK